MMIEILESEVGEHLSIIVTFWQLHTGRVMCDRVTFSRLMLIAVLNVTLHCLYVNLCHTDLTSVLNIFLLD